MTGAYRPSTHIVTGQLRLHNLTHALLPHNTIHSHTTHISFAKSGLIPDAKPETMLSQKFRELSATQLITKLHTMMQKKKALATIVQDFEDVCESLAASGMSRSEADKSAVLMSKMSPELRLHLKTRLPSAPTVTECNKIEG
jgi:hypothetical protein